MRVLPLIPPSRTPYPIESAGPVDFTGYPGYLEIAIEDQAASVLVQLTTAEIRGLIGFAADAGLLDPPDTPAASLAYVQSLLPGDLEAVDLGQGVYGLARCRSGLLVAKILETPGSYMDPYPNGPAMPNGFGIPKGRRGQAVWAVHAILQRTEPMPVSGMGDSLDATAGMLHNFMPPGLRSLPYQMTSLGDYISLDRAVMVAVEAVGA